jgi:adenylate cyclase
VVTALKRALRLNPSDAAAHAGYAEFLSAVGRHAEALSESKYALELDPSNRSRHVDLGWIALRARQYDFAIEELAGVEDNNGLGWTYLCKKMYPQAIAVQERLGRYGHTPFYISSLAEFYGLAGRKREALLLIAELKRMARHRYISPGLFVDAYVGIGDKNQALTWLERGYEEHDEWMIWTKVWPLNDELRSDPRFEAIIRKMNYPQ